MSAFKIEFIVIVALFFATPINASPTANEFVPCKKLAVALLKYCLQDDDKQCWSKSKASYHSCRKDVIQRHVPDIERINAKKKRIDEIEREKMENID